MWGFLVFWLSFIFHFLYNNNSYVMVVVMFVVFVPPITTAAALLGLEIFVAGGQSENEVINSAEVYNPELNQWEHMVARLLHPRVGLALVSMGNMVYAMGECMPAMCRGV